MNRPIDSPVVIVVFVNYQDLLRKEAHTTLDDLEERFTDEKQIAVRQFPVVRKHSLAPQPTKAAQGKIWAMHDLLFMSNNYTDFERLAQHAKPLHMDVPRCRDDLERRIFDSAVQVDISAGKALGEKGTPTFWSDGKVYSGARSTEFFAEIPKSTRGIEPVASPN